MTVADEINRGPWTKDEDEKLRVQVQHQSSISTGPTIKWSLIAVQMRNRNSKQCRERWLNHLDPGILRTEWSTDEDEQLHSLHTEMGNQWTKLSGRFPGRTENGVKNRFQIGRAHV